MLDLDLLGFTGRVLGDSLPNDDRVLVETHADDRIVCDAIVPRSGVLAGLLVGDRRVLVRPVTRRAVGPIGRRIPAVTVAVLNPYLLPSSLVGNADAERRSAMGPL